MYEYKECDVCIFNSLSMHCEECKKNLPKPAPLSKPLSKHKKNLPKLPLPSPPLFPSKCCSRCPRKTCEQTTASSDPVLSPLLKNMLDLECLIWISYLSPVTITLIFDLNIAYYYK